MDGDNTTASESKITGAAIKASKDAGDSRLEREVCTVCLEPISERAVCFPCNHLTFDFLCLVSWLQEQQTCPLCKAKVSQVQYDWRAPHDFKTYHVPLPSPRRSATDTARPRNPQQRRELPSHLLPSRDTATDRRRHIYRHRLYALHVGVNRISKHRDFTAREFAGSTELQTRARMFLRRELQVFSFLDADSWGRNRDFLIEYLVAILKTHELRSADGKAEELVKHVLGLGNTRQLLHELEAWLRSPHTDLRTWDACVQYAEPQSRRNKS